MNISSLKGFRFIGFATVLSLFVAALAFMLIYKNISKTVDVSAKEYVRFTNDALVSTAIKNKDAIPSLINSSDASKFISQWRLSLTRPLISVNWPNNEQSALYCNQSTLNLFHKNGVKQGEVNYCLSKSKVTVAALSSNYFLIVIVALFVFLISFSAIYSNYIYKVELSKLFKHLKSGGSSDFEKMDHSKDSISGEIISLVDMNKRKAVDLLSTNTELKAEKEASRIIRSVAHDSKKIIDEINVMSLKQSSSINPGVKASIQKLETIFTSLDSKDINKYSFRPNAAELTDLSPIFKNVIRRYKLMHPALTFKTHFEGPLKALCNQEEFERILVNLFQNSIEACSAKPLIRVHTFNKAGKIQIKISDNGKGISSEIIDYIFEENFTFGKKDGVGIGLYSVKKKIYNWLGTISTDSEIDKGTTFTISLHNQITKSLALQKEHTL